MRLHISVRFCPSQPCPWRFLLFSAVRGADGGNIYKKEGREAIQALPRLNGRSRIIKHTKKAANGAAGQVEGLLSEWIHLEWKNWRERFRRCRSAEPPQPDAAVAALLRRVLLWCYPAPSPLGVHTARYTEVGMFFFPLALLLFPPLFKKITYLRVCTHTVTLSSGKVV